VGHKEGLDALTGLLRHLRKAPEAQVAQVTPLAMVVATVAPGDLDLQGQPGGKLLRRLPHGRVDAPAEGH
jgi:hypothetical protein